MHHCVDRVRVRCGPDEVPLQLSWRGSTWQVLTVLAHWWESAPWWSAGDEQPGATGALADLQADSDVPAAQERQVWRLALGEGGVVVDVARPVVWPATSPAAPDTAWVIERASDEVHGPSKPVVDAGRDRPRADARPCRRAAVGPAPARGTRPPSSTCHLQEAP